MKNFVDTVISREIIDNATKTNKMSGEESSSSGKKSTTKGKDKKVNVISEKPAKISQIPYSIPSMYFLGMAYPGFNPYASVRQTVYSIRFNPTINLSSNPSQNSIKILSFHQSIPLRKYTVSRAVYCAISITSSFVTFSRRLMR